MRLVDARRLTGANLLSRRPLVVVEIALDEGEHVARALEVYREELARIRSAVGLPPEVEPCVREHLGGAVFGYQTPIDTMLASAEMSEWAATSAAAMLAGGARLDPAGKVVEIEAILVRDRNPHILGLQRASAERSVPFLWDDAATSVGLGRRSLTWTNDRVPDPTDVPWAAVGRVPVAMVTGTNGKTTTTRLLAQMAREGGGVVGSTSSDGVVVGAELVEEGDFTGPAGARMVLRRPDVDVAVLETARGGILRRGLAIDHVDVALLTNVSADHVGGYGVDDVAAMAEVKAVVAHAVLASGVVVLNARDPNLLALAPRVAGRVVLFADLDAPGPATHTGVAAHLARGGEVVMARDGAILRARGGEGETPLLTVADVPITFTGLARYNVENVLGAVAAAPALGLDDDAIVRAARRFDARDNPGRGELFSAAGVNILVDFAHNPEGVRAAMQLGCALRARTPGASLTVITGSAGDRRDEDIRDIVRELLAARPDRVLVRELEKYLRGRAPGEVPETFRRTLVQQGLPEERFARVASEVEGLERALAYAVPGDVIALLVHVDHSPVRAFLEGVTGGTGG